MTAINPTFYRLLHGFNLDSHGRWLPGPGALRSRSTNTCNPGISSVVATELERNRLVKPSVRLPLELDNPFDVPADTYRKSIR